jgi:hypothetical protein
MDFNGGIGRFLPDRGEPLVVRGLLGGVYPFTQRR